MLGDHDAFRGIFAWTKDHFGFRNDRLFSSEWGKVAQNEKVTDSESTSSADIQIAYSLLVAYERWGDEEYLRYAQAMLSDLWENGVVNRYGYMYIKSGTDSSSNSVDTASLQPNFFRKFQDYDKKHSWNQVAESSLQLASLLTSEEVIPGSFLITSSDSITPLDSINSAKALYIGVSLDNIHHPSSQAAEILSLLRSVDPHIADSSLKDGYYGVPNDLTDFTNNFMLTAIAIKEFPGL